MKHPVRQYRFRLSLLRKILAGKQVESSVVSQHRVQHWPELRNANNRLDIAGADGRFLLEPFSNRIELLQESLVPSSRTPGNRCVAPKHESDDRGQEHPQNCQKHADTNWRL